MYIFRHIPTNAYAILCATFQQEFKHPKFKHPNGIPDQYNEAFTELATFRIKKTQERQVLRQTNSNNLVCIQQEK